MSADAVGWAYRHSPLKGSALLVHLAVADSVNDQHYNEFWMSVIRLAEKSRVERRTAGRALQEMIEAGMLTLLEDHTKERKPSRYRFEFPDLPVIFESRSQKPHGSTEPMTRVERTREHGSPRPTNPSTTQEIPNTRAASRAAVGEGFNAFWRSYPRKEAKTAALKSYERAIKRLRENVPDTRPLLSYPSTERACEWLNERAEAYARLKRGTDPQYICLPTTWLNEGRYDDERVAASSTADDFNSVRYS